MILRSNIVLLLVAGCAGAFSALAQPVPVIRINQLGYTLQSSKVAVYAGQNTIDAASFALVDSRNDKPVFSASAGRDFGAYGPFTHTFRLDFSAWHTPGNYYLRCGSASSPIFRIDAAIYDGAPDFILRYLRQQRSGFNPFLKDSCHTHDGYTMYGPMPDSSHIDASGGWHDATDYLQYATTSANATFHLLSAWQNFPGSFGDQYMANGLGGPNGTADVLDEAKWGLDWLLKLHPRKDWIFHQLADDRDHHGFRLPSHDSVDYGPGPGMGRPVYFASGKPQGLGKYKNRSTGIANIAGKFSGAFALGASVYRNSNPGLSSLLQDKALSAFQLGLDNPGVCQTAPNREPYFYEEDNWTDDMELAAASLFRLTNDPAYRRRALEFGKEEPVTPWMGRDTARHYQFYPFHNPGHYELARALGPSNPNKKILAGWYRDGIEKVWTKAKDNAFFRGIPFIWCSNNLTVSFAIQCYCYRQMTGDSKYLALEQACFDWLFGCNPWGAGMVYGLPVDGITPLHPHSSLSYLYGYPLDGGLVDGPVYGSIYRSLRGLKLFQPDKYADFQSPLVVYHDDAGDYSTNEPTMDGTASLVWLLAAKLHEAQKNRLRRSQTISHGAVTRGDSSSKNIALVFTGDEFGDGGKTIAAALKKTGILASFFLTGNFYRNPAFHDIISQLQHDGHYLGSHSDRHLLYCDWMKRDSLLVSHRDFDTDIQNAYTELRKWGIDKRRAPYFLPPYEWYNDSIAEWSRLAGLRLVNFTPGSRSNADYTFPDPAPGNRYVSSDSIIRSILHVEKSSPSGLNGYILLLHIGTDPRRTDKVYNRLEALIRTLQSRHYRFVSIDRLLAP